MFWKNKRILVTGHTGFKGGWLCLWLTHLGARVYGYALEPPTHPSLFVEADLESRLAGHVIGDVRDHEALARYVAEIQPEIIFHLAAQPLVRRSYQQPRETLASNVMGTVNLLEAARSHDSVRVIQIITSDKCYRNREWDYAYRENDALGGDDPYSASKAAQELVTAAWRRSFFSDGVVSVASCRAGNVIGGGDWAVDRILPDCIRALEAGRSIEVRNPESVRPWQHVLEPLGGYLLLAREQWRQPRPLADAWNFGPGHARPLSVAGLVDRVVGLWGDGDWAAPGAPVPQPHEHTRLQLDITRAMGNLGWQPVLNTREALTDTVTWYRERYLQGDTFDAGALCLAQIEQYQARDPNQPRREGKRA